MREILLAFALFGLFVGLAILGSLKENERKEDPTPVVDTHVIDQVDINDAFIDNPKKWGACDVHEAKIWDQEEGYILPKYEHYPVTNIVDATDYDFTVKGEEVHVTMTCGFIVFYNAGAFLTLKEEMRYPGGQFTLEKRYYDNGRFARLAFK